MGWRESRRELGSPAITSSSAASHTPGLCAPTVCKTAAAAAAAERDPEGQESGSSLIWRAHGRENCRLPGPHRGALKGVAAPPLKSRPAVSPLGATLQAWPRVGDSVVPTWTTKAEARTTVSYTLSTMLENPICLSIDRRPLRLSRE